MSARDAKKEKDWPAQQAQAQAIVDALNAGHFCRPGGAWMLHDNSQTPAEWHGWQAVGGDGLTLDLGWPEAYGAAAREPARLTVGIAWPIGPDGQKRILRPPHGQEAPITAITVAANKPAMTIAKEINRRLIPSAGELYAEATRLNQQAREAGEAQTRTVAAILAAEPGAHLSQNSGPNVIYLGATSHAYTVRVDGAASIRFEPFSVDLPRALKVLEALRILGPAIDPATLDAVLASFEQEMFCALCGTEIGPEQSALSMARAADADPACADCLTLQATEAKHAEGHDYINPVDLALMIRARDLRQAVAQMIREEASPR